MLANSSKRTILIFSSGQSVVLLVRMCKRVYTAGRARDTTLVYSIVETVADNDAADVSEYPTPGMRKK